MVSDFVEAFLRDGATLERFREVGLDGALLKIVERSFEDGATAAGDDERRCEDLVAEPAGDLASIAVIVLGDDAMSLLVLKDPSRAGEGRPKRDVQASGEGDGCDARVARADTGRANDACFHFAGEFVNALAHFGRLERRHVGRRFRRIKGAANDLGCLHVDGNRVCRGDQRRAKRRDTGKDKKAPPDCGEKAAGGGSHV